MSDYIPPPSTLPPGSIVWSYLRDSGGERQERSVPQQQEDLKIYCSRYGLTLTMNFADVAKSGGSDVGRDQFLSLVDMTVKPDFRPNGLLIWNYARFARDTDDSTFYKAMLRKRGIIVHSLTDPIPDGPYGRVVETIIDIANEEKLRQTARDVKRGLESQLRKGYSAGGFPPRGYKAEEVILGESRDGMPRKASRWVPDPELWDLIQLAWKMRAEGRSYTEIQEATGGRVYVNKSCWPTFFTNKTYLGIGKCGKVEIPNHHPAAVDMETWEAVQVLRQSHPKFGQSGHMNHPRRLGAPSLLSGLAVCAICGSTIYAKTSNVGRGYPWHYYFCGKKDRQGKSACAGQMINARQADQAVLEAVMQRVLTSDFFNALLAETRALIADTSAIERQIERIKKDMASTERSISRLLDALEKDGLQSVGDRLQEREQELARLQAEMREARAKQASANLELSPDAVAMALQTWCLALKGYRESNDILALRNLLTRFVNKVELGYNTATVTYTYPLASITPEGTTPRWGHLNIDVLLR